MRPSQLLTSRRHFFSSPIPLKKKTIKTVGERLEPAEAVSTGEDDPYDLSTLEIGIEKVLRKLEHDLSKLRTGGRFNPEVLESLTVQLSKHTKGTEKLRDVAQVVPKGGRSLIILVGEKEHVKPITSAIQGATELNLQPQPDAYDPLLLNIAIPPPTKESRTLALTNAHKVGEVATIGVKTARAAMQKKLRGMELKRVVRPDDLKKAHREMDKVVEKGNMDVKRIVDAARKTMVQA